MRKFEIYNLQSQLVATVTQSGNGLIVGDQGNPNVIEHLKDRIEGERLNTMEDLARSGFSYFNVTEVFDNESTGEMQ